MDPMMDLLQNVIRLRYEDLSDKAIQTAKLSLIDTIGCVFAGCDAPGCDPVKEQVIDWCGKQESSIMVFGNKVSCPGAAFVNSTMARALDFDTTWVRGMHMSAASVPTALAVAEMKGDVSGKELLTAMVAGEDLAARIHLATTDYNGFEPTGVCGIFGLTAMSGRILGLTEREMLDSMGIALNRAAGTFQPNIDGALVIRVMEGFASRSAVESAILARKGISGGQNPLNGDYGYARLFSGDAFERESLTRGLGRDFLGCEEMQFKKFPACGGTASAIQATLELVASNDIMPADIAEVTVDSNQFFHTISGKEYAAETASQANAQFSYRYTIANAIVRRRFSVNDIRADALKDVQVLSLANKIHPRLNNALAKESFRATVVEITTSNGDRYRKQVNHPKGSVKNPLTRDETLEKYLENMETSMLRIPKEQSMEIVTLVDDLESVDDVTKLMDLLTPCTPT